MGCCVSTHENSAIPKHSSLQNNPHQFSCVSKSPPRAEEEAVKEVLSETPKPKLRPESPIREHLEEEPTKSKLLLLTPKKAFLDPKFPTGYPDPYTPEEISEVSEMCSFSTETISTTTLKEEDDHHQLLCTKETTASTTTSGEVRQRVYRSQGYNGNYLHQQHHYNGNLKNQGRSPARRRPEPSPPRRRQPGPGAGGPRRSQSPEVRGHVGRSPSARRTGPSPGRVRMVRGPENGKRMEEDEEEIGLRRESDEWQGPKESLENPLVSLECFIFL